jgi:3-dehydroquinate dehydratase type I
VDIEFDAKGRNRVARAARRARVPVVFSHHEARRPLGARAMESLAARMRRAGASVVKIAPQCRRREDLVEALAFLGRTPNRPVAVTPMGRWGKIGRVVAPVFGSALEYVPVSRPVVEGQVAAPTLDRLRASMGLS